MGEVAEVNDVFRKLLAELLGPELYKYEVNEQLEELYAINFSFEAEKKKYGCCSSTTASASVVRVCRAWRENTTNSTHVTPTVTNMATHRCILTMSKELMTSFHEPFLSTIVDATRTVLHAIPDLNSLFVVDGAACSGVVIQRQVRETAKVALCVLSFEKHVL